MEEPKVKYFTEGRVVGGVEPSMHPNSRPGALPAGVSP